MRARLDAKNNPWDYEIARNFKSGSGLKNPFGLGLSLRFHVSGESDGLGFLCLLFFSCCPINVAGGYIRCSWGNSPL